jgi:hypothetical protein
MNPALDPAQLGLRDIHLPEAIGWWPFAFGWWTLCAVAVLIALLLVARYARFWRHRAAQRALRRTMAAIAAGADPSQCALEASTILRRFAMTMADDRDDVAGLVGNRWLDYLDSRWERAEFAGSSGQLLLSSPYRPPGGPAAEESLALCELCVDWVKAQSPRG